MSSIYQLVLGEEFYRVHPRIQERFGFSSADRIASIGRGTMVKVWHGAFYTLPFLHIGKWRRIMFPESAENVPFQIENYAYLDRFGRETVTWLRTFETRKRRRFDAYMIYSHQRNKIVDYLGTHQHLAVDIDLKVGENGGLCLRSVHNDSTKARSLSGSHSCSAAWPMFANGSMNAPAGSRSRSGSQTKFGVLSLDTEARSMWNG